MDFGLRRASLRFLIEGIKSCFQIFGEADVLDHIRRSTISCHPFDSCRQSYYFSNKPQVCYRKNEFCLEVTKANSQNVVLRPAYKNTSLDSIEVSGFNANAD